MGETYLEMLTLIMVCKYLHTYGTIDRLDEMGGGVPVDRDFNS